MKMMGFHEYVDAMEQYKHDKDPAAAAAKAEEWPDGDPDAHGWLDDTSAREAVREVRHIFEVEGQQQFSANTQLQAKSMTLLLRHSEVCITYHARAAWGGSRSGSPLSLCWFKPHSERSKSASTVVSGELGTFLSGLHTS